MDTLRPPLEYQPLKASCSASAQVQDQVACQTGQGQVGVQDAVAERDRIVGAGGDRHRILAVAAVEGDDVGAVAERERIDPAAADEQVGAIAAAELVVASSTAIEHIALQRRIAEVIVAARTLQDVVAVGAVEGIDPAVTLD
ncbi:hypothetical protein LP420_12010 [Massilia sp. B-10]|nr:hypothetical protein LP420_12010 [Massilia sp. B-10]